MWVTGKDVDTPVMICMSTDYAYAICQQNCIKCLYSRVYSCWNIGVGCIGVAAPTSNSCAGQPIHGILVEYTEQCGDVIEGDAVTG